MTAYRRLALNEFGLASAIYQNATVWVFAVNPQTLVRTTELLTLYDGPTGTGLLANPGVLSSDGKWATIPYVEAAYQIVVNSLPFGEHELGVVVGESAYMGEWSPTTIYQRGDTVKIGPAAEGGAILRGDIYIALEDHTASASFSSDASAGKWVLYVAVGAATAAAAAAAISAADADAAAISAINSAIAAGVAETGAEAAFDSFDVRYLGAYAVDPTLDNDGNPLITGALHWNTVSNAFKSWSGVAWITAPILATPIPVSDGGTGATDASGARTNLGAQASDAELTAIAGLTSAADKGLHFTGVGTAATHDLTAAGRAVIGAATASDQLTALGFSAFGKTMIDDADAAAARNTIGAVSAGKAVALAMIFGG